MEDKEYCDKCPRRIKKGKEKYIGAKLLCEKCFNKEKYGYDKSSYWQKWIKAK